MGLSHRSRCTRDPDCRSWSRCGENPCETSRKNALSCFVCVKTQNTSDGRILLAHLTFFFSLRYLPAHLQTRSHKKNGPCFVPQVGGFDFRKGGFVLKLCFIPNQEDLLKHSSGCACDQKYPGNCWEVRQTTYCVSTNWDSQEPFDSLFLCS